MKELERIAARAEGYARDGERLTAVLAAEPHPGARAYLCAFEDADGARSWLALDPDGEPVSDRQAVRDAVSIAAVCELAEEVAAGGDLDELRSQLAAVRVAEAPPGIEEAEEAALELQRTIGAPPQVASPGRLEAIGTAARRLELALDATAGSPFAAALKASTSVVDELTREVEAGYKAELR